MDVVRQSLAITFVFLLLWAALWFLKKRRGISFSKNSGGRGLMEARAKLALSAQHALHLVRVGDRELVLALHPSGITLLCDLPRTSAANITSVGER